MALGSGAFHLGDAVIRILGDAGEFNTQLQNMAGQMDQAFQGVRNIGMGLTAAVTVPILGIGAGAIKMASDFDQAMRNVNALLQLNEEEFTALKERVLDVGTTTRSSAVDMADALLKVSSAGYEGEEAMIVWENAVHAAAAAGSTVDHTANLLIATLKGFGYEVDQSDYLLNLLVATANEGIFTFSELAQQFGEIVPSAKMVGVSVEETAAAYAAVSQVIPNAAEAATRVNAAFTALMKPSEKLRGFLEDLGYATGQEAIEALGLEGVLRALSEAYGGNAEAMADLFPNIRAMQGMHILMTDGAENYTRILGNLGNVEGSINRAKEQQYASLQTQVVRLQRAFENILISIGEQLIPILTELLGSLIPILQQFRDIPKPVLKVGMILAGLAAAFGPVLLVVGQLGMVIATVVGAIGDAGGLTALLGAVGSILAPIVGVVAAVAAAFAGLFLVWQTNFLGIRDVAQAAIGEVQKWFGAAITAVGSFVTALRTGQEDSDTIFNALEKVLPEDVAARIALLFEDLETTLFRLKEGDIVGFLEGVRDILAELIPEPVKVAITAVSDALSNILDTAAKMADAFSGGFLQTDDWDQLGAAGQTIITILSLLRENLEMLSAFLRGDFSGAFETVRTRMEIVQWFIEDTLIPAFNRLREFIVTTWEKITEVVGPLIEEAMGALAPVIGEAQTAFGDFWADISPKLVELAGKVGEFMRAWWDLYVRLMKPAIDAVMTIVRAVVDFIREHGEEIRRILEGLAGILLSQFRIVGTLIGGAIKLILDLLTGDMEAFKEDAKEMFTNLWNAFKDIVFKYGPMVINAVAAILGELALAIGSKIKEILSDFIEKKVVEFRKHWHDFWTGIKETLIGIWEDIKNAIQEKLTGADEGARGILERMRDFFVGIWDGIRNFLISIWERIPEDIRLGLLEMLGHIQNIMNLCSGIIGGIMLAVQMKLQEIFLGILVWVGTQREALSTAFHGVFDPIVAVVGEKLGEARTRLQEIISDAIAWIGFQREIASIKIHEILDAIKEAVSTRFEEVKTAIQGPILAAIDWVSQQYQRARNAIGNIVQGFLDRVNETKESITTAIKSPIQRFFDWCWDLYYKGKHFLNELIQGFLDGINDRLGDLERVLQYIRDLLPGSLAEIGPLSVPIRWEDLITGDLDRTLASLQSKLTLGLRAPVPTFGTFAATPAVGRLGQGAQDWQGRNVTIEIGQLVLPSNYSPYQGKKMARDFADELGQMMIRQGG